MQCATSLAARAMLGGLITMGQRRWRYCSRALGGLLGGRSSRNMHLVLRHLPPADVELHRHPDTAGHGYATGHGRDETECADPFQRRAVQVTVTRAAHHVRAEGAPLCIHIHQKLPLPLSPLPEGRQRVTRRRRAYLHRVYCRRAGQWRVVDEADATAKNCLIAEAAAAFHYCQVSALALTLTVPKAVKLIEQSLLGENVALLLCGRSIPAGSGINFQRGKAFECSLARLTRALATVQLSSNMGCADAAVAAR